MSVALGVSLVLITCVVLIESIALSHLVRVTGAIAEQRLGTTKVLKEDFKIIGRPLPPLDIKKLDGNGRIDLAAMRGRAFGLVIFKPIEIAGMNLNLIVSQLQSISRRAGGQVGVVCVGRPRHCRILSTRLTRNQDNEFLSFFANAESESAYRKLGVLRTPIALTVRPSGSVGHVGSLESVTLQEHRPN